MKKRILKVMLSLICIGLFAQLIPTYAKTYDEYTETINKLEENKNIKEDEKEKIEEKKDKLVEENKLITTEIVEYQEKIKQLLEEIETLESKKKKGENKEKEEIEREQTLLQSNYLLNVNISKEELEEVQELQKEIEKSRTSKNYAESYDYLVEIMQNYNEKKQKEYQNHINLLQVKKIKYEKDIKTYNTTIENLENEIQNIDNEIKENKKERIRVRVDSGEIDIDMIWPCPHTRTVTSGFGYRSAASTNYVGSTNHGGIDISAAGIYGTSAIAVADGIVEKAGWDYSMGNYVVVKHSTNVKTYYMHGSKISVSVGDYVETGDEVLKIGSTGASTGAHLHFGVMVKGTFVNPWDWLN